MGQQANSIFTLPVKASGDVGAYRGVDFNGAQIAAAGAKIIGVSKRGAALGELFEVATIGTATCEAGAAFARGAALMMDAQGRVTPAAALAAAAPGRGTLSIAAGAVAVTSTVANGGAAISGVLTAGALSGGDLPQFVIGHALEEAVNIGDFIEVLLCR